MKHMPMASVGTRRGEPHSKRNCIALTSALWLKALLPGFIVYIGNQINRLCNMRF